MRSALHVVLFLVGLLGTAAGIREIDTLPFWSWTRPRIGYLQQHRDEFDTVFFGSSRVNYGVVPAAFDARMQELGNPTKSFNLGLSGTRPHDFNVVIEWFLSQRPGKLRYAIIELHAWNRPMKDVNWMTDQEVEANSTAELPRRFRSMLRSTNDVATIAWELMAITAHTLANHLRIGQAPRLVDDLVRTSLNVPLTNTKVGEAGFIDLATVTYQSMVDAHKEWLADSARRERMRKNLTDIDVPIQLRGGFDADSALEVARVVRAAGVTPIFLVMPSFSNNFNGRDGVDELRKHEIVLELDRIKDHPQLFDFALWHDHSHMNRQGAELFSRYVADQLQPRLGAGK